MSVELQCVNRSLLNGTLYVTPNYVCFDTTTLPGGTHKVVIPRKEIASVKKVCALDCLCIVFGRGFAVRLHVRDGGASLFVSIVVTHASLWGGVGSRVVAICQILARVRSLAAGHTEIRRGTKHCRRHNADAFWE